MNNVTLLKLHGCDKVTHRHTLKQTHKCANSPEEPKATACYPFNRRKRKLPNVI